MTPTLRPAIHDFDVITDAPAPDRRLPEMPEEPPQSGPTASAAVPEQREKTQRTVRAAE